MTGYKEVLYIETETSLSINKAIFIRSLHPDTGGLTRITGKIVRVDANGLGVEFEEPQPDI